MELSHRLVMVLPAQWQRLTNKTVSEMLSCCLKFKSLPSLKLFNKPITTIRLGERRSLTFLKLAKLMLWASWIASKMAMIWIWDNWATFLTLFCWFVAAIGLEEPSQPVETIPFIFHFNNSRFWTIYALLFCCDSFLRRLTHIQIRHSCNL